MCEIGKMKSQSIYLFNLAEKHRGAEKPPCADLRFRYKDNKKDLSAVIGLKNNYSSNFHMFLFVRNGRQDKAPKIPIMRNSIAAPEPFPAPNNVTQKLLFG